MLNWLIVTESPKNIPLKKRTLGTNSTMQLSLPKTEVHSDHRSHRFFLCAAVSSILWHIDSPWDWDETQKKPRGSHTFHDMRLVNKDPGISHGLWNPHFSWAVVHPPRSNQGKNMVSNSTWTLGFAPKWCFFVMNPMAPRKHNKITHLQTKEHLQKFLWTTIFMGQWWVECWLSKQQWF